ncbi:MAG: hypothetical protein IT550_04045 [Novosphingobium sp.]|nr:hypothetical protein [Novosphingobium sp.]
MGKLFSRVGKLGAAAKAAAGKTAATGKSAAAAAPTPSPNPMTNILIADIALRGGGRLLRHAVERGVLGVKYSPEKAQNIVKGRSMAQTLIGTAIARVATRSVPGAIIVGGGLLAKALYDRRKDAQAAKAEGEAAVARQASRAAE